MIGIFDSGIGGLSIWKAITLTLPEASTLYIADQIWAPYGNKAAHIIAHRSHIITEYLISQGCSMIVVACNTATVTATIHDLRNSYPQSQFVGVEPPIKLLASQSKTGQVAVLATQATCQSHRLQQLIHHYAKNLQVTVIPTLEWAQLVENSMPEPQTSQSIQKYLQPLTSLNIDFIGLGCTHYTFLQDKLAHYLPLVTFVDVAVPVAKRVKHLYQLDQNELPKHKFVTTSPDTHRLFKSLQNLLDIQTPVEYIHL